MKRKHIEVTEQRGRHNKHRKTVKSFWDLSTVDIVTTSRSASNAKSKSTECIHRLFFERMRNERIVCFVSNKRIVLYDAVHLRQCSVIEHGIDTECIDQEGMYSRLDNQIIQTSDRDLIVFPTRKSKGITYTSFNIQTRKAIAFEKVPSNTKIVFGFSVGTDVVGLCLDGYAHRWNAEDGTYKYKMDKWSEGKPSANNNGRVIRYLVRHLGDSMIALYSSRHQMEIDTIDLSNGSVIQRVWTGEPMHKIHPVTDHGLFAIALQGGVVCFYRGSNNVSHWGISEQIQTKILHVDSKYLLFSQDRTVYVCEHKSSSSKGVVCTSEPLSAIHVDEHNTIVVVTTTSVLIITHAASVTASIEGYVIADSVIASYMGGGKVRVSYDTEDGPNSLIYDLNTSECNTLYNKCNDMPGRQYNEQFVLVQ